MRIVLVTHFYPAHGGGVEKVAAQLAARMAVEGAQVVWCASDTDAPPDLPGVRCEPMAAFNAVERLSGFPYPLWGPRSLSRLAACVRAADAVHVHDCIYAGSIVAAQLARRHRKRLVVTQHIGIVPLPPLLRPVLGCANRIGARAVLRHADGVGFISPVVRRYFEGLTGPSPRFHYVANGVDAAIFHPVDGDPAGGRAASGFCASRPLLLFVGRFVPKKRLPLVRDMAALTPEWQWCVIGQGPEDPRGWGLPNVRVMPPMAQADLAVYYRAADLLVLPSEGEGFPLVVQEGMACGLPACISAEVAAGSTLPAGLWIELSDVQGEIAQRAVDAIAGYIQVPALQRRAQRASCARYAAQVWDWDAASGAHIRWMQDDPHIGR
jgi:glycosyltransferase involved in cell wall biosynthesis